MPQKNLKSRLALMTATAAAVTYLAIPSESNAYEVGYFSVPDSLKAQVAAEDSVKLERIVSQNSFPQKFNFFYVVPPNEEGFAGNFELRRDKSKTELEIRVIDKNADKLFNFSEERVGDSVFYCEREYDFPQDSVLYKNRLGFSKKDRLSTLVSLTEQALNGEIPNPSFIFQGSFQFPKKYKLKTTSSIENGYDLILSGEIEDNSRRIPKITASFKKINGKLIPIEIEVFYRLNVFDTGVFGKIHVTPNIRGVLTEKK